MDNLPELLACPFDGAMPFRPVTCPLMVACPLDGCPLHYVYSTVEQWNRRVPAAELAALRGDAERLLNACQSAAELYDLLALGPLGMAAKYGPDRDPPSEEEMIAIRQELHDAIEARSQRGRT